MSIDDLLSAARATALTAEQLAARFARELASVLRDVERQLPLLVKDAAEGSRTAIVKASQANQLRVDLRSVLKTAGYDALADLSTGVRLDTMTEAVLAGRRLANASAALSRGAELRVAALRVLMGEDMLDEGDVLSRALWKATVRGIFGTQSVDQILIDLGDVVDYSEAQIGTLYDTSVSVYGRQVEALQAGDDPEATFLYAGPNDTKTRPFCATHVGKVYTREQIDALDNGQIDNTFLTAGGYNCRHVWMEVSKFSELRDLVGTDKRIPEVKRAA